MQPQDIDRIVRLALRELGVGDVPVTIAEKSPDQFEVMLGGSAPATLMIRAGSGTTSQFVRQQIFDQFPAR